MQCAAKGTKTLNPTLKKKPKFEIFKTPIGARSCKSFRIVGH
jgi:hypothetical protein